MSSLSSSVLAASLLPMASDSNVVDFLLERASYEHVCEPPSAFKGVWSSGAARKAIKGPLVRACAVASHPGTDPEVLAAFAKDSRVSVRHALLANPSTPYDTVRSLAPWALERKDSLALEHAVSRLVPTDLVDLLALLSESDREELGNRYQDYLPVARLARKCLSSRETALRAAGISWYSFAEAMARFLARRPSRDLSLTELVEAFPERFRGNAVAAVLSRAATITCELALLAQRFTPSHGYRVDLRSEAVLIEPGALEIIADLGVHNLAFALANGLAEESVSGIVATASVEQLDAIVSALSQRRLSSSLERRVAKRLIAVGGDLQAAAPKGSLWPSPPAMVGAFLRHARHALPEALLLDLLRSGSAGSTSAWLACPADSPNGPGRGGLITALVESPGNAFSRFERVFSSKAQRYEVALKSADSPAEWLLGALARRRGFPGGLDRQSSLEVARIADSLLPGHLASPAGAHLAMPVLEDAFGANAQQWETFLTLASDWSGGFADLVEATCALSGIAPLSPPSAPSEVTARFEHLVLV